MQVADNVLISRTLSLKLQSSKGQTQALESQANSEKVIDLSGECGKK